MEKYGKAKSRTIAFLQQKMYSIKVIVIKNIVNLYQ